MNLSIKRNLWVAPLAVVTLALFSSARPVLAQAQDTADTDVIVVMENFVELEATQTVTLTPTLADIVDNNYIDEPGAITLTLRTNNATGAMISAAVRYDASPTDNKIAPSSFFLKGGSESAALTSLGTDATDIDNYTSQTTNLPGGEYTVPLDLRVGDLQDYSAEGGITTNYSNTLVFTAIANS